VDRPRTSRIAVVGVGAIGGAVAADLAGLARHELQLCSRTPFERLIVRRPDEVSRVAIAATTDPQRASQVDWVLLATKAHQSAAARPWLEALCQPGTGVAVLQNGIDHEERIRPLLAAGVRVLPVVVQLPAEKTAPGEIEQGPGGLLLVADDELGREFAELFDGAATRVQPTARFHTQAWWKLVSNAALGGVCALLLRENAAAREPELRELVLSLMREVVAVGRAEGADLPDDAPEKSLDAMLRGAPDHWTSIAVDRREGRAMEWEVRNAVVGRLGRRHGIATPLNDALTALLQSADRVRSGGAR
jgi:2-dehydropantoate 2-reductase